MSASPIAILRDAQRAVPAVKYAAGVAGIAAVVAIVAGFQLDYRIAVFGTIIVFALMFMLVVFSALVAHSGPSIVILAILAAWAFLLLTIATSLFLLTSYFFSWPRPIGSFVEPQLTPTDLLPRQEQVSEPPKVSATLENLSATGYANLSSTQGDFVGQGAKYRFSDENGMFTVSANLNSITITFREMTVGFLRSPRPKERP